MRVAGLAMGVGRARAPPGDAGGRVRKREGQFGKVEIPLS